MLDIAYVAGIVDGEGFIGFNQKDGKYLRVVLEVRMTNLELIKALHDQFGGSFAVCKIRGTNNKQQYRWQVSSNVAVSFIQQIQPYMIVKREQIKTVLLFSSLNVGCEPTINHAFKTLMHKINKRGLGEQNLLT